MVDREAAVAVTQALRQVLEQIVERPEKVSIVMAQVGDGITFDVRVAHADVGRVIGRGGLTAKSLRTIVSAMAHQNKARYELRLPAGQRGEVLQ